MPELPEVETVARGLRRAGLPGRRIDAVDVRWPRIVAAPALPDFRRRLTGRQIATVTRRAKYLLLALDNGATLAVHLRMTGRLHLVAQTEPRERHHHLVLTLDDGRELRYHDTRKFGRWQLLDDLAPLERKLGPEPLAAAFTPAVLRARLAAHRRMLKPLLLDQSVIAGLGNIYVDEALWDAGLHPCRASAGLPSPAVARLHAAIRAALRRGIRAQGTTLGTGATNFYSVAGRRGRNQDELRVFRRTGTPCPRCGAAIRRLIVGQRSTHVCPRCQRLQR